MFTVGVYIKWTENLLLDLTVLTVGGGSPPPKLDLIELIDKLRKFR